MSKKEKMVRALGLPEDVILRVPQIELTGRGHLRLDHYRSILEFQENRLVVSTSQGVFTIEGRRFISVLPRRENWMWKDILHR